MSDLPDTPAPSRVAASVRRRVLVVGGVAGGASCAARLQRLDESLEIDVIATAIQFGGTVHDLAAAELCYAPQFGAAKDPVNLAGMLAENVLNGDMPVADWSALGHSDALLLDVREPEEFTAGHMPGAVNLPLSQLRERYAELPTNRDIWISCGVGQRAYYATRFLTQHGYRAWNLPAGYATYSAFRVAGLTT